MIKPIFWIHAVVGWSLFLCPAFSQVIPDKTLGNENSIIEQQIQRELIKGGAVRGSTLFHSLKELSIKKGQQVYFANPSDISIILARVTGGNPSNINGTLGVLGNADLFLMNPSGITFGPNATLNLDGSFIATTGNSFVFENGQIFSATNPQAAPNLRISVPVGIQFNGTSGPIEIEGNSTLISNLQPGMTFALFGNEVNINSSNLAGSTKNLFLVSINNGNIQTIRQKNGYEVDDSGILDFSGIRIQNSSLKLQNTATFISGSAVYINNSSISTFNSLENNISINEGIDIPKIVKKPIKIYQSCRPGQALGNSSFVNIGRGGVPLGPNQLQTPSTIWQDLRSSQLPQLNLHSPQQVEHSREIRPNKIYERASQSNIAEARGWTRDDQNRIVLTAQSSKLTAYDLGRPSVSC